MPKQTQHSALIATTCSLCRVRRYCVSETTQCNTHTHTHTGATNRVFRRWITKGCVYREGLAYMYVYKGKAGEPHKWQDQRRVRGTAQCPPPLSCLLRSLCATRGQAHWWWTLSRVHSRRCCSSSRSHVALAAFGERAPLPCGDRRPSSRGRPTCSWPPWTCAAPSSDRSVAQASSRTTSQSEHGPQLPNCAYRSASHR
jgi:hypothetical protein